MKKYFILGAIFGPFLFFAGIGVRILLTPKISLTSEDMENIKLGINYEKSADKTLPSEIPFFMKKDGKFVETKLSDFKGKPTIVRIWASWCNVCEHESIAILAFAKKHKDKFTILFISLDKTEKVEEAFEIVEKYTKEKGGYDVVQMGYDNKVSLAKNIKLSGIPTTLFINAEGFETGRINGAFPWNDKTGEEFLKTILPE